MFEQLLKLMKELYDENTAPGSWSELVYNKSIEEGYNELAADQLANAAESIAEIFAQEMMARLEAEDK